MQTFLFVTRLSINICFTFTSNITTKLPTKIQSLYQVIIYLLYNSGELNSKQTEYLLRTLRTTYSSSFRYELWRVWTMRQPNGCSTPAPRSSAAKQWFEQLAQKKNFVMIGQHYTTTKMLTTTKGLCGIVIFIETQR